MASFRTALLDTSVVIDYPAEQVAAIATDTTVSAVTVAELAFGVSAVPDPIERLRRQRRLQRVVAGFDVLPFDTAAAQLYGVLVDLVRQHGRNPRPRRLDLQIAAVAASNRLPLLTRNADDFAGLETALPVIGLPSTIRHRVVTYASSGHPFRDHSARR